MLSKLLQNVASNLTASQQSNSACLYSLGRLMWQQQFYSTSNQQQQYDGENWEGKFAKPRFLVTGAAGQVGVELVPFLREKVGRQNVIASDIRIPNEMLQSGPTAYCDVVDQQTMARIILENGITHVVHLATVLSAVGERNPALALRVNTTGIQNILDLAAKYEFKVFAPSTIAAFGMDTPKVLTPDITITNPSTMYGITKVHQELLGAYYAQKFGVDYRSLRYPGIISAQAMPGGGTTDYAVEIFHEAVRNGRYSCFISMNTGLPMMYMPDCLQATWQLMMAPKSALSIPTYNVTSMSFTPMELALEIKKIIPHFQIQFAADFRDEIAKTWPTSIDDQRAQKDWGWRPKYDLSSMTQDMVEQIVQKMGSLEAESVPAY